MALPDIWFYVILLAACCCLRTGHCSDPTFHGLKFLVRTDYIEERLQHGKVSVDKVDIAENRYKRQSGALITGIDVSQGQQIGEVLLISGENLDQLGSNVTIVLGSTPCICMEALQRFNGSCHNNTFLACLYQNATEPLGVQVPLIVTDDGNIIPHQTPLNFTFKENVIIDDVSPRKTITSGGTRVTVRGENFLHSKTMIIQLQSFFGPDKYDDERRRGCAIQNDTYALCLTPRPAIPTSYFARKRRKRQVVPSFCLNDRLLDVNISLQVGLAVAQITDADGNNNMCVTKDPEINAFTDDDYIFRRYNDENQLQIFGERLTHGIAYDDYKVYIGLAQCNITSLQSNVLYCDPPLSVPELGSFHRKGDPLLRVLTGASLSYAPGYIVYQHTKPVNWIPILGGLVGALAVLLVILLIYYIRRNQKRAEEERIGKEDYQVLLATDENKKTLLDLLAEELRMRIEECKLNTDCLIREKEIGSGHYGKVFIGKLKPEKGASGKETPVAIKTIKDDGVTLNQLKEFLEEATLMKDLKHENILDLVGVVIDENKPYVILPYMEKGDLKSYVSDAKNKFKVVDLIGLCIQVADGMTFISEQKIVHRDLRAVNCLVSNDVVVKVADFGLSRDIYEGDYYTVQDKQRPLPIKWMAVETLEGHPFSTRSDVWSYGVLMWEVFTRGLRPYADIENNYDVLKQYFRMGRRLERPQFCTHDVYAVMMSCWEKDPHRRKTFRELSTILNDLINSNRGPPPAQEPTETSPIPESVSQQVAPQPPEALEKDIDAGYFKPRASTNEYIKTPGVINEYLTLLAEENAKAENKTQDIKSAEETRKQHNSSSTPSVHYANGTVRIQDEQDDYLKPTTTYENVPDPNNAFVPSREEALSIDEGEKSPYFVNPPISDTYFSPEGKEKVIFSANQPRGELYEPPYENTGRAKDKNHYENGEVPKEGGEKEREPPYKNVGTNEDENSSQVDEKSEESLPIAPDVPLIDTEKKVQNSGESSGYQPMGGGGPKTETSVEDVELDVKSLASKFGEAEQTKDYVNQPAYKKRLQSAQM